MKLIINGDSHTAGAEAVNAHAFAEDDGKYVYMGRSPHPDNLKASWGKKLGNMLNLATHVLAESASSNDRILRTTNDWLSTHPSDVFVIIQWSTWEREEWNINGEYFQVNASGIDWVPESHKQQYKEFVANVDWNRCTENWHKRIIRYHEYLNEQGIPHLFFNGNTDFGKIKDQYDFGPAYMDPYTGSYDSWLQENGYNTVAPDSYHYDERAHGAWAKRVMRHILDNKLI
jgi:hypothetical protein